MPIQYLKTREVAQMIGVSLNTLYRWLKSEKINEPNRNGNNNYRMWRVEDVDRIRKESLERPFRPVKTRSQLSTRSQINTRS